MADEEIKTDEQVSETPPTEDVGQAAEAFVDLGGKQVPLSDVQTQFDAMKQGMHEAHEGRSTAQKELKELQGWALPIRDDYNEKPEYRQGFDALYSEQASQAPISQDSTRMREIERHIAEQDQQREFDQLRADGFTLSKEDESKILNEVVVSGSNVKGAFRELFWNREMKRSAEGAKSHTAETMAQNQQAYEKTPPGQAPSTAAPEDVNTMYKTDNAKWAAGVIDDIKEAGFNTGWD